MNLYWIRTPVIIGTLTPGVWLLSDASLTLTLAAIMAWASAGASIGVMHEIADDTGEAGRAKAFAQRAMLLVDPRLRDANDGGDAKLVVWVAALICVACSIASLIV